MFFHYLKSCRKKLQSKHLTKKINKDIYDKFMNTFIHYSFNDNISKKRIRRELSKIEKQYKLDDNISNYYLNQWYKYIQNKSIYYK